MISATQTILIITLTILIITLNNSAPHFGVIVENCCSFIIETDVEFAFNTAGGTL